LRDLFSRRKSVKTLLVAGSVLILGALVYGGRAWLAAAPETVA
jgi:hypothetical protein